MTFQEDALELRSLSSLPSPTDRNQASAQSTVSISSPTFNFSQTKTQTNHWVATSLNVYKTKHAHRCGVYNKD